MCIFFISARLNAVRTGFNGHIPACRRQGIRQLLIPFDKEELCTAIS